MGVVYLTTPGTSVRRKAGRLQVFRGREKLDDVRLFGLDRLVVGGGVQLSAQAIGLLLDEGVDVAFVTATGRLRGSLVSVESPNVYLRLAQFERFKDAEFRLAFGREVVRAKLGAQRALVMRYRRNHPDRVEEGFPAEIEALAARAAGADDADALRGLEGAAAKLYYRQFARMLTALGFPGRKRRPPPDPANALLSLGYTLLTNELGGRLEAEGFDPAVGLFHGLRYGRRSLALDLVEPFRQPVVDRLTLRLLNRRQLGPDDFEGGEKGMRLGEEAFKRYLGLYEAEMRARSEGAGSPTWRERMREEIGKVKEMVLSGEVGALYTWPTG